MLAAVFWREIRRKSGWYIKQKTHDVPNCNAYIWYVKVTQVCLHTRKMTNCVFSYVASRFSFITNLLLLDFFQKTCILWLPYKKGPFYNSSNIERNQINCASFADFWKGKEKKKIEKRFKKKQGNDKKKAGKHTLDSMVLGFLFVILHTYSNFFDRMFFCLCFYNSYI